MKIRAAYAAALNPTDPLAGLRVGEIEVPDPPEDWVRIRVTAASLNHHDLWTLRGVGIRAEQLPMVLGCDAAGVEEKSGREVIVHSVIASADWAGDETLDPNRSLLSERHPGTLAEFVWVPRRNVLAKPAELSAEQAACLPTAWLTAYRMLFVKAGVRPGDSILVQGASGGVATACISLARAAGLRVFATARTEAKRDWALRSGANDAFDPGARLPVRVDAVLETVGAATWAHSARSLRPGGRIVISGATSGPNPAADLNRIFFLQLSVVGSTMGTRGEFVALLEFLRSTGVRPPIDRILPLDDIATGLAAMADGELAGKVVISV